MLKRQAIKTALAMVMSVTMAAAPALANPGNGNGNGEHGNSGKNIYHGNKGNHGHSDNAAGKGQRKNYGKPDHVDRDISYTTARALAVNYGLTGYKALPPGIAKISRVENHYLRALPKKRCLPRCSTNYLIILAMSGGSLATIWY